MSRQGAMPSEMRRHLPRQRTGFRIAFERALLVVLLASVPAASPGHAQEGGVLRPDAAWSEARLLSDEGRYEEALAIVRVTLAQHPDDASLLWLEAGITGWAGRHAESVALYEKLVARHPEKADEVRVDLSRQRLYAGDTQGALSDLALHLMRNPGDREARLLRAEALTYADRFAEAVAAYGEVLNESPDDPEARRGMARALNWRGDHRQAAALYEQLYAEGARDEEVLEGLAHARYWGGRSDLAYQPLDDLLQAKPRDRAAGDLARQLAWERGPVLGAEYARAFDTDDLELRQTRFDYRHPAGPHDLLHATWSTTRAQDPTRQFRLERAGVGHERLWSDTWETHALLEYQYQGPAAAKHPLGDAYATYRPDDAWRMDFGVSREQVLSARSLELDLLAWTGSVGADWHVTPHWTMSGALRGIAYSDDNTGLRTSLLAQYRTPIPRLDFAMHLQFEHFAVSHPDNGNGYYAPSGYFELTPGFEMTFDHPSGAIAGLEARFGIQKEDGTDADPMSAFAARVEIPVVKPLLLGVRGSTNDSNLAVASGYGRDEWGVYLRTRF